jgi:type II secretory pathway pseudopilin PulG
VNKPKREEKMKGRISERRFRASSVPSRRGFTVIEVLVGSLIMLAIVVATLSLYTKSNRVSVDQQQFAELQHDVRAAMYFLSRDIKSIGAGLPLQFAGYFLQGTNNDSKGNPAVEPDRITFLGNSDPLRLIIQEFEPGPNTITLEPGQFELYPYNTNSYPDDPLGYIDRLILILPNPDLNDKKGELGKITAVDFVADQITFEGIVVKMPHDLNLNTGGSPADYVGGTVNFVELKTYWLDVTGSYPGMTAGERGYLGQPGVLYASELDPLNNAIDHLPLALDIEDFQLQYHGDLDGDQQLDDNNDDGLIDVNDFQNWDEIKWTNKPEIVAGIRSIRFLILGKTANPYVGFSGNPSEELRYIYGKPAVADSPVGEAADKHRRFLLESTAQVRNMSLNIYNSGTN